MSTSRLATFACRATSLALDVRRKGPRVVRKIVKRAIRGVPTMKVANKGIHETIGATPITNGSPIMPISASRVTIAIAKGAITRTRKIGNARRSRAMPRDRRSRANDLMASPLMKAFCTTPSRSLPPCIRIKSGMGGNRILTVIRTVGLVGRVRDSFSNRVTRVCIRGKRPMRCNRGLFHVQWMPSSRGREVEGVVISKK